MSQPKLCGFQSTDFNFIAMKKKFILLVTITLYVTMYGQNNAVPVPVVTGPITGPGTIFCASIVDLKPYGYMEEEYFVEGKAQRYDFQTKPGVATPLDPHYPYKTRIIVRRPVNPEKFNGTVVVEWLNVSSKYDVDSDWWQLYDYLMRSGYAWVGVSAQPAGVQSPQGLRNWNPARYGSLDVGKDTIDLEGPLRFDIYSQAVMALKGNPKVQPLGNLHPEFIIATGHSRSAWMLTFYYNLFQPITGVIDGFMIRGQGPIKLRTDIPAKVFKINAETDLIEFKQVEVRQPDSDRLVTWELAGTSHADQTFLDAYEAINRRDFGSFTPLSCDFPMCSLIPFHYGFEAAMDHLNRWIRLNITPPAGIPITVQQTDPDVIIERDSLGNALGGIRLPQFDVPVAMNTGKNKGQNYFCRAYGTHKEFDKKTLKSLYPTHQIYMKQFDASVQKNLRAGYILEDDTSKMLNEARDLSTMWE